MNGYTITLSNGDTLTTISPKSIDDQANTSLVLIGQGVPNYGQSIAQDLVWMLENFSDITPPANPLIGQEWYDLSKNRMNVYTNLGWQNIVTQFSGITRFDMLTTSRNVDMTVAASVPIFTGTAGRTYIPMFIVMVPVGGYTASIGPTINVSRTTTGDVIVSVALNVLGSTYVQVLKVANDVRVVTGATTVNLHVTAAATGGQLNYDVHLFGFTI